MNSVKLQSTAPYWLSSAFPEFPSLKGDTHADVVVVGAGITGLTAAYFLSEAGKSVVVLERDRCAGADTGHTSAHLTMVTDARLPTLVERFGRTHAQAAWDAGLAAMVQIDEICRQEGIDAAFAFVDGYLHLASDDSAAAQIAALEDEAALADDLGFDAEFVAQVPLFGLPGIRFGGQGRIHARKYLAGLAKVVTAKGVRIHEQTEATEFSSDPLTVRANGHTVACKDVIIATHNPLVGTAGFMSASLLQTKLALYTSYVVAGRVPKGAMPDALWWDTAEPYHYLRVEPHGKDDVVIFGGQDHKTGQAADTASRYARLEETIASRVSAITFTHRWSGQVIQTPDDLPYIGATADPQYAATGFSGNGLTFGTLGAMIMSDRILGRANPWTDLFDPSRKATKGAWNYLKENADYPYYMIRDRFAGAEGRSLRSVKRGQGKVIDLHGEKVAAYRDDHGATTLRSAVCTHLGCLVAWNEAERTWDCPCHGSRFSPNGEVIGGPAESPLAEVKKT